MPGFKSPTTTSESSSAIELSGAFVRYTTCAAAYMECIAVQNTFMDGLLEKMHY